jgi:hypothetical protein
MIFVNTYFFLALMFMATIGVMLAFVAGRYVR